MTDHTYFIEAEKSISESDVLSEFFHAPAFVDKKSFHKIRHRKILRKHLVRTEERPLSQTNDQITEQIKNRRTFAIISHPDAGKTTLTEKFLLYGGAINLAGTVKGRKAAKHAVSDWMEIEKERGISVTSSAMQFNYEGFCINILDTRTSGFLRGYLSYPDGGRLRCYGH